MSARILVVDDEPDISALVAYQLARESYRVRTAASGPEALEAIEREVPDLVVLDLMLPGMSGLEVLAEIRRREELQSVPVILLTARREEDDRIAGLEAAGPVFFKHNVIDMPYLQMEFGVPLAHPVEAGGEFTSGALPAGRYAEITYTGPYDDLITVNGVLIGWARHAGLVFDSRPQPDGEWFAHRSEILHNNPAAEPDPAKLRTTVTIKLREP